jgi:hypothetical protein
MWLAALVLAAVALDAQLPETWRHWQFAAPIEVTPAEEPRFVSVLVPDAVTAAAARDWADLRVIDEAAREVPYVLEARDRRDRREWRAARLLDPGFVPGQYSQAVLDLGSDPGVHNAVVLELGGTGDVQAGLQIAVSDDGQSWQIAAESVPIFRLRETARGERTDATYPASRSRYVRLRILEGSRQVAITSARVAHEVVTPAERAPAGVALAPAPQDGQSNESVWMSGDRAERRIAEVRFETSESQLARLVVLETADEHDRWRRVATGEIRRMPGSADRRLSIQFPEAVGRRWRVTVQNGDDPPVPDLVPVLYATPRRVVFRQEPGRTYRLIYGHARPDPPRYDLARLTSPDVLVTAAPALLGAPVVNEGFVDATPWTERHPAVVWVAVAVAVLLLGAMAVRTLRSSASGIS